MKPIFLIAAFLLTSQFASGQWIKQNVNTTASFRGLSVVNEKVIWASGTEGTVIRTVDSGKHWDIIHVPDADKLDFRDIEAFDAGTAYILSIGNGESSRIYKTTDGGNTWVLQFKNTNEKAFFDAIACWDKEHCIAVSDPIDNRFVLVETTNGQNWRLIDTSKMPPTRDGEAAFAASGTCLITEGKNNAFLVSGGKVARVFKSTDRGKMWKVYDTPIVRGTSGSGIFSIAMRDSKNGVIVGGNYENPAFMDSNIAITTDGGATWKLKGIVSGYRSCVTYVEIAFDKNTVVAVGTNGSDRVSFRIDRLWDRIDSANYNAVAYKGEYAWAVGPNGLVVRGRFGNKVDIDLNK